MGTFASTFLVNKNDGTQDDDFDTDTKERPQSCILVCLFHGYKLVTILIMINSLLKNTFHVDFHSNSEISIGVGSTTRVFSRVIIINIVDPQGTINEIITILQCDPGV